MKEYVLNYYSNFKCIAGECKHTCCAGWEMCIDNDSLNAYKNDQSKFSTTLKKGINFKKSKFKSDKRKRCAFLNDKGLCEIITNLGEESLCQVCRDHPRFRGYFNDRTEMGLGFCCEQASRIILSFDKKIEPILISDDKKIEELDFNQKNVLAFRQKAIEIVQDRATNINKRVENLLSLCKADLSIMSDKKIVKAFLSLERLDKKWTIRLKSIKGKPLVKNTEEQLSLCCEQFIVNGLYRHLSDAEDTMWVRAKTITCVLFWYIILSILEEEQNQNVQDFTLVSDIVRALSAEVEYSEKNLDKIYSFSFEFIEI